MFILRKSVVPTTNTLTKQEESGWLLNLQCPLFPSSMPPTNIKSFQQWTPSLNLNIQSSLLVSRVLAPPTRLLCRTISLPDRISPRLFSPRSCRRRPTSRASRRATVWQLLCAWCNVLSRWVGVDRFIERLASRSGVSCRRSHAHRKPLNNVPASGLALFADDRQCV